MMKKLISIRIDEAMLTALDVYVRELGWTRSHVVGQALETYLEAQGGVFEAHRVASMKRATRAPRNSARLEKTSVDA